MKKLFFLLFVPFAFLARAQNPIVINSNNTWQATANAQSGNSWATPAGLSNSAGWVNATPNPIPLMCGLGNYGSAVQAFSNSGAVPIWYQNQNNVGLYYFRKDFVLNQNATSCAIQVMCDDSCAVFVNGVRIGNYIHTGNIWNVATIDVPLNLLTTCATNVIGVKGRNISDCGVLMMRLTANVSPGPTATITGNSPICFGNSTQLTASGGTTYLWNNGASAASITLSPSSTTTYTVTVTSQQGCSTTSKTVTVNPAPTPNISGQASVCKGASAQLTASGGASYKWNTGATSASITVTPTSTSTYTVTVTNALGCTKTATKTVTVNPLPTASITGLTTICQGFPAVLTASGAGTGGKYKWSTGASTAAITVMPSTTTSYTVTVTSAAGCSSTKSTTVTVAAVPVVKINLSSLNCNGTSATISLVSSVSGGNAPYTYKWSNGATTANLTNVPVGAYSLTVTTTPIATGDGCTKVVSKTFCNPCASNTSPNEFGNGTEPGDIAEVMTAINPQEADISLEQDEFIIVPNPATDDLTIRTTKGTGHSEIIIFDILGAIRQRDVLYQNEETIDISNLQDGMYLISILTDGKLAFTKKIVKQRAQ